MRKRAKENIWTYGKANKVEGTLSTTTITLTKEEKRTLIFCLVFGI
jgi:hypothetical protein